MIKINEIFYSIQGESSYAGWPTVFVRTSGCNLRCTYCDTSYAYYEGRTWSEDEIINEVASYHSKFVCVTGGEPLAQKSTLPLMRRLCDLGYKVSLETSGSFDCGEVDARVKKIIDVKTPDSGAANSFLEENLQYISSDTEFKFVICSEGDFAWAEEFAKRNQIFGRALVLYSPAFNLIDEKWLAKKILSESSSARLQLQLHKYIWSPHTRGV